MRLRILLALIAVGGLSIALFTVPLAIGVREFYRNETVLSLERQATEATGDVPRDYAASHDQVEITSLKAPTTLGFYDPSGRLVAGVGPAAVDPFVTTALTGRISDRRGSDGVIVAVPVTSSETVIGAMWIETTAAATNAKVYRAWGLMVALAVLVIGVSAVAAWFLARRLSRPVQALTQNIDRLGAGSFELDIEPSGVAELDEAQRALTATAERLDAVLSRERAFSAEASHQLRTPVASLRLAVEAELADPRPDATIALEEALIDIDRLDATVTSLLALARSSIAPRSDLDLGQVTDRAVSRWRSAFAAEGRPLRLHQPADAIRVVAREAAIDQAVDVLLDNALIHGEDEASVTLAAVAGGVTLSIRTDGPPIDSPDEIWATPTSPERPRIGLPLARRLVEAEGGRLVLAQPAPHPTFEIVLPT